MKPLSIGLYGLNGHQIHNRLVDHPLARLTAVAAIPAEELPEPFRSPDTVRQYGGLDALLQDDDVQFVSLCSPRRADQAGDAVRCLEAGKHVYAEKPCALSEPELDEVLDAARRAGRSFHEMAGTAFEEPYLTLRRTVAEGALGEVVQVLAQKSYPYHEQRPQDEDLDGGLLLQVGVHALRYIEHVAGVRVRAAQAAESGVGNPAHGDLRMAVSLVATLENGGVAAAVANYLNPRAFGRWGNEHLRIFGTRGFVEAVDGGTRTRLVLNDRDCGPLSVGADGPDYLDRVLNSIVNGQPMPLSPEDEVHPTRVLLRAREHRLRADRPAEG